MFGRLRKIVKAAIGGAAGLIVATSNPNWWLNKIVINGWLVFGISHFIKMSPALGISTALAASGFGVAVACAYSSYYLGLIEGMLITMDYNAHPLTNWTTFKKNIAERALQLGISTEDLVTFLPWQENAGTVEVQRGLAPQPVIPEHKIINKLQPKLLAILAEQNNSEFKLLSQEEITEFKAIALSNVEKAEVTLYENLISEKCLLSREDVSNLSDAAAVTVEKKEKNSSKVFDKDNFKDWVKTISLNEQLHLTNGDRLDLYDVYLGFPKWIKNFCAAAREKIREHQALSASGIPVAETKQIPASVSQLGIFQQRSQALQSSNDGVIPEFKQDISRATSPRQGSTS